MISYRSSNLIRASSWVFLVLTLFFLSCLQAGAILYAIVPQSSESSVCILRPWFSALSLMGILGVLVAKTNRVDQIFNSSKLQVKVVTDLDIFKSVGILLIVQIALLIGFSASKLSLAETAPISGYAANFVKQCRSHNTEHLNIDRYIPPNKLN